jgi:hypothetical protein
MNNQDGKRRYYSYRIKLEELKQRTWLLVVLARVLLLLSVLVTRYL